MNPSSDDSLWQQLSTGFFAGRQVLLLTVTDSTNLDGLEEGRRGAPAGTLIIADSQTGGRGRLGRKWLSPPSTGLYFSIILRPRLAPADLPKITLAAGLAVCQAVEAETGLAPAIKWPNDLLLDSRKFCGILTESEFTADTPLAVLGIGLNVTTLAAEFPPELRERATSLLIEGGRPYQRGPLLAAILNRLDAVIYRLETGGFGEILAEWRQRDGLAGKYLSWVAQSGEVVSGISLGPDEQGILRLRDHAGVTHEVLSGDLKLAGLKKFK
jgi:BirA family transcriptional regulator, biotin operon repressor / biotin---[acetyl-CoA-carboxylase] ligase